MSNGRLLAGIVAASIAIALALALDSRIWTSLAVDGVYEHDWGRMLRVTGSLVFWLPLSVAVWLGLRQARVPSPGRAWLLLAGATLAGGVAEVLKLLIRRERPSPLGEYVFRGFADHPWSTTNLGFPSSHVMVAFGGAAVLARLFPAAAPVGYVLATGCAITRVVSRAHFASDAVGGALAGWAIGVLLWRRFGRPSHLPE